MVHYPELILFLNRKFVEKRTRNPRYSLRAYAKSLQIGPAALSEILRGKRKISPKMALKVGSKLNLPPSLLLRYREDAENPASSQARLKRPFSSLTIDQLHMISDWHYFAILSLAETVDFKEDLDWIGTRLGIDRMDAELAVDRLLRLGNLRRELDGLLPTGEQLATPDGIPHILIRKSHFQNLKLAKESLVHDSVKVRDFTAMTMAIDPDRLQEARRRIRNFRRKLCEFLEGGEKKEVYKLCLSLFPLSRVVDQ